MTLTKTVEEGRRTRAHPTHSDRASSGFPGADVVVFTAVATFVACIRFLEMRSAGAPATVDSGNWIAWGDALFGRPSEATFMGYPPVVPVLTTLFVDSLGLTNGIAALGAATSLAPAAGVFVVVRRFRVGLAGAGASLLVLGSSSVGEATAWGGFPQLIGLGALPLYLQALSDWADRPTMRRAARAGAWLCLIGATSHFVLLLAVTSGVVLVGCRWPAPNTSARGTWLRSAPWLMIPSLWLIPTYVIITTRMLANPDDSTALVKISWSDLDDSIEFIYRAAPGLWRVLLVGAVLAPLVLARQRFAPAWHLPAALTAGMSVALVVTRESRYLYAIPIVVVLWIGVALHALDTLPQRRFLLGSAAVLLSILGLFQVQRGNDFFDEQREFYTVLSPSLVETIDAVAELTPPDAVIAVPAVGPDHPLGWWVEPLSGRRTIYGLPLRWLIFEEDVETARIGNSIFTPEFPQGDTLEIAKAAGVDYLLLPRRWAFYDEDKTERLASEIGADGTMRFEEAILLRLKR